MKSLFATHKRDLSSTRLARQVLLEWLITAVISLSLVVWLASSPVMRRGNDVFYDMVSNLTSVAPHPDIAIVAVDDRSLEALGAWPWPRGQHGRLIDRLSEAGVRSIVYDVLFLEETPDDTLLGEAMARARNVYVPVTVESLGMDGRQSSVARPPRSISDAAAGLGHAVLNPDTDGTVRSLSLWVSANGEAFPHIGALALLGHPQSPPRSQLEASKPAPPADNPTAFYASHKRLIRYPSGVSPYPTASFIDILRGEVPDDFLKDKLVLVGATAQGMGDRYATPNTSEALTPGVNIIAAFMQEILNNNPTKILSPLIVALTSLLPLAIMLLGFLALPPSTNTILGLLLIVGSLVASWVLLNLGVWWPPLAACVGVIFVWPLWSWRRLAAAHRYIKAELNDLQKDSATHHLAPLSVPHHWRSGDETSRYVQALSAALKQFRDFNRYITQSIASLPDAALVTDPSGTVLTANLKAESLFNGRDLHNNRLDDLFVELGYRDWRSLLDNTRSQSGEIQMSDGRSLSVAIAPLIDTRQKSAGLIVRIADVSRLRAAERERQLTLQLLGHDMRAPQVSILTLLSNEKRGADIDEKIRRNAHQTLSLAEGYVQLSRAENQLLSFALVNLSDLVTEAADTLWPQSAAKGVELIIPEVEVEYLVEADMALMRRVIINLLDNAIRHTPTGGMVACRLSVYQDKVLLIICDQGPGIDDDMKTRLFKPFAGGNVSGSGLGLAFVHTVIQRHAGKISITPPDGIEPPTEGACFYILLPRVEEDEA